MRLTIAAALALALTAPAIAQPAPTAIASHAPAAPATPAAKAPPDLAQQVFSALLTVSQQVGAAVRKQEIADDQKFERFAYSVYAPLCAAHKGFVVKSAAVKWNPNGDAWPATVFCADGTVITSKGPTP